MDQLNRASRTANPQLLFDLASAACKTCTAFLESVKDLRMNGERFAGDTLRINYSTPQVYTKELRTVLIDVTQIAVPVLDSRGQAVRTTKPGKGAFVATVSFVGHRWIINRLQVAKP